MEDARLAVEDDAGLAGRAVEDTGLAGGRQARPGGHWAC